MANTRLIIETSPILGRMSGIGHNTLELIKHLHSSSEVEVILAVPFDRVKELKKLVPPHSKIKKIPIPIVVYNLLGKLNLLPPLDLFLGRGVYLFPNYRNTKLLFSKSFTYVYDASFIIFPEFVSPKNKKYLSNNIDSWIRHADRILTISKSAKIDISKYLKVPEAKISIIPCGVDTSVFFPQSEKEVARARKKYGIKGNYVLYVGNIEPRKNLVRLIKAYRKVYDKHSDLSLVLVGGDGWENGDIIQAINESIEEGYPIIRPSEYVPDKDLPALYTGAMMLAHPARYEGFGISPLQAMACATPVIVANNSSMPEVVLDTGLYVNASSVDDIENKILAYYENENLRKVNIQKGFERVKQYSWDKSASKLLELTLDEPSKTANQL